MRRKDREITDPEEILDILNRCPTIRIAMNGDPFPYVVPVSFGWECESGKTVIWFHCAREGQKLDYLKKDCHVSVEGDLFLRTERTEHGITSRYESVIGFGECRFCTDPGEILHSMRLLTAHYGESGYPLERCRGLDHLLMGKITLEQLTGKRNLPDPAKDY